MTDQPPHVLVVDDDALVRTIARAVLQRAGMTVTEATDGREALDRLGSGEPVSLVLLDLEMPRMNGMETLRSIRDSPSFAAVRVLMLSASDEETERQAALDAGANGFIRKPISPDRLLASVRQVLAAEG